MKLRYFYKINHKKQPIPGSNVRRKSKPGNQWLEIQSPCCTDQDIPCTCGPRYFVQLDASNKPVDGTLIKRNVFPRMESGIRYMEIEWKSVCCHPGEFLIQGFGGDDPCVGGTATFYANTETIAIGTYLYESDQLTPVTFSQFRDDSTGIIYDVINGLVTGINEDECSQIVQVVNIGAISDDLVVTGVTVDDVPIVYTDFTNFPIAEEENGQFKTTGFAPGLRTVKISITGTAGTPSTVTIADSAGVQQNLPYTVAGVYTFTNVFISGPNLMTAGTSISVGV